MPFSRTLGIEVIATGPDAVRARLEWSETLCTTGGALHGGAIMALADSPTVTAIGGAWRRMSCAMGLATGTEELSGGRLGGHGRSRQQH
jgi:uncharacterized protein (TIGR00369 family)